MFRSFLVRLALILSTTADVCLLLMAITLGIQKLNAAMYFCIMLLVLALAWTGVNLYVQRKIDPELSAEVARILYPSGVVLSLFLSGLFSLVLEEMIPGNEGNQHWITLFVGLGVAFFLGVRSFDIKWLRLEEEIVNLEERRR